jgi:hypothetical protein
VLVAGSVGFKIILTRQQWEWIVEKELRGELLDLVEDCTADEIVAACQEKFGFEPKLRLSGETSGRRAARRKRK